MYKEPSFSLSGFQFSLLQMHYCILQINYISCLCLYSFKKVMIHNMSRIVRKPDFCLGENKGADQLRGNREADQRLCFRYSDSTIPLLLKSEISSFYLFSELVQAGLCRTWSETPKTGFLASRLILSNLLMIYFILK